MLAPAWTAANAPVPDDGPGWGSILLQILIAGAVIWFVYRFILTRRADFTIRVRDGRVEYLGKVPFNAQASLTSFLTRDLELTGNVRIMGNRLRDRLELWFDGPLTAGQKQRIRNFLLTRL
jgi:hypothetical protein